MTAFWIVGDFVDSAGRLHGYLRVPPQNFTKLDFPGAVSTLATGINNAGGIVGFFDDASGRRLAYVRVNGVSQRSVCRDLSKLKHTTSTMLAKLWEALLTPIRSGTAI